MYITLETDYAIRIVDCLARAQGRMGAKEISGKTNVTLRFSLKILRKLVRSGIVCSYKGTQGGYKIGRNPEDISVNDILESIQGPYILNRCMNEDHTCSRSPDKTCVYHCLFADISYKVRDSLQDAKISSFISK